MAGRPWRSLGCPPSGVAAVGLMLLCIAGCGEESDVPAARLKGRVTLDGNPIAEGTINFYPEGSGQAPPGWKIPADGGAGGGSIETLDIGGIRLKASHTQPASLSQTVAVREGEPFVLEVQAYPYGPLATAGVPTVSLKWAGIEEAPLTRELTQPVITVMH